VLSSPSMGRARRPNVLQYDDTKAQRVEDQQHDNNDVQYGCSPRIILTKGAPRAVASPEAFNFRGSAGRKAPCQPDEKLRV